LRGRLFDLGRYPGAVADDSGRWHIQGQLYRLMLPAPLLARLDAYEGCASGDSRPQEYRREQCPVECEDGVERRAWVYLYNLPVDPAKQIETGDYLHRIANRT
jgi:gamma-glutamylcyclotransferase (GGCT)/AIG2-like uncharacterized protein YtfP